MADKKAKHSRVFGFSIFFYTILSLQFIITWIPL